MSHPIDYIVRLAIFEPTLIAKADRLRRDLGQEFQSSISPLPALEKFKVEPIERKGVLTVCPVEMPEGSPPARVKYNPLRLFIDKDVLDDAKYYQDSKAHEILAHEIGHMIFHDNDAKEFSSGEENRIKSVPREFRTEWHAERFADHYLAPMKFIIAYGLDTRAIALNCNVPIELALRQVEAAERQYKIVMTACGECGRRTLSRLPNRLQCLSCKAEYSL